MLSHGKETNIMRKEPVFGGWLSAYPKLVILEFDEKTWQKIFSVAHCKELFTCPAVHAGTYYILPKAAIKWLPLKDVACRIIEARSWSGLSEEIQNEVERRHSLGESSDLPHYYVTPTGKLKDIVLFSAVKEIMRKLKA